MRLTGGDTPLLARRTLARRPVDNSSIDVFLPYSGVTAAGACVDDLRATKGTGTGTGPRRPLYRDRAGAASGGM